MKISNLLFGGLALASIALGSCDDEVPSKTADSAQRRQQEQVEMEGASQVGFPAITNFAEKRELKQIYEMRDQQIVTYSYILNVMSGKFIFLGETIGFPLPYATEFTNPQKLREVDHASGFAVVTTPQADPNGLFSPASADATWVLMRTPDGKVQPQYIEDKVECFTFKLPESMLQKWRTGGMLAITRADIVIKCA